MTTYLIALALALAPTALTGEKTDVVVLENGNELLGEIKSMKRGNLQFKTDSAGTITIEWDEIRALTSPQRFRVERLDGEHLVGTFVASPEERVILLQHQDGRLTAVPLPEVARLREFDQSAWERVDGYIGLGFSSTKANNLTQYSLGAGIKYFERENSIAIDASSIVTDQDDSETTSKSDLNAAYRRLRPNRWFGLGFLELTKNTELALDLRATVAAGPGRYLYQSQSQELAAFVGLAYTYEAPEGASSEGKYEGVLGLTYDIFISDTPETALDLNWLVYPGITESDRIRSTFDLELTKEIVEDFSWNITYYLEYDSSPTSSDGEKTDYGLSTGISYTF